MIVIIVFVTLFILQSLWMEMGRSLVVNSGKSQSITSQNSPCEQLGFDGSQ